MFCGHRDSSQPNQSTGACPCVPRTQGHKTTESVHCGCSSSLADDIGTQSSFPEEQVRVPRSRHVSFPKITAG